MAQRTKVNKGNVDKLIQVWNEPRNGRSAVIPEDYKGLELWFHSGTWRLEHATDFPEFCSLHKRKAQKIYEYTSSHHPLPAHMLEMLLAQEVSYEDLEAFITLLVKTWDEKVAVKAASKSKNVD